MKSEIFQLYKNKAFHYCLIIGIILGIAMCAGIAFDLYVTNGYMLNKAYSHNDNVEISFSLLFANISTSFANPQAIDIYYSLISDKYLQEILMIIFISITIGQGFQDKLIGLSISQGAQRITIYMRKWASAVVGCIIINLIYIITTLLGAIALFGWESSLIPMPMLFLLKSFIAHILLIIIVSSIYYLVAMLIRSKIWSLAFSLLFCNAWPYIINTLSLSKEFGKQIYHITPDYLLIRASQRYLTNEIFFQIIIDSILYIAVLSCGIIFFTYRDIK